MEQVNIWIPVREYLPEVGNYVLVWGIEPKTYGRPACHVAYIDDDDGNNSDFKWMLESGVVIKQVTHWQMLPQSPVIKTGTAANNNVQDE